MTLDDPRWFSMILDAHVVLVFCFRQSFTKRIDKLQVWCSCAGSEAACCGVRLCTGHHCSQCPGNRVPSLRHPWTKVTKVKCLLACVSWCQYTCFIVIIYIYTEVFVYNHYNLCRVWCQWRPPFMSKKIIRSSWTTGSHGQNMDMTRTPSVLKCTEYVKTVKTYVKDCKDL